ncbi:MAG: dihydrofolate reductase [Opitutaceae bacterium]|nr:dihydrofolate reductase [Opitutaceae bacterium]
MPKPLHLIVACSANRVIGREGRLPWRLPEDLAHFHAATAGRICVLGRVCYETWPRVHADGRQPIVITSRADIARPGARAAASLPAALAIADKLPCEVFICGGERIYAETLTLAGTRPLHLHLTLIHATIEGDTFMPEWRYLAWREVSHRESADDTYRYTFSTLELPGGSTA